jgi:hypothetical protein
MFNIHKFPGLNPSTQQTQNVNFVFLKYPTSLNFIAEERICYCKVNQLYALKTKNKNQKTHSTDTSTFRLVEWLKQLRALV